HLLAGRYEEAASWAEKARQRRPNLLVAIREAAASNALAGHLPKAHAAMALLRQQDPELRISNLTEWLPLRQPHPIATSEEALGKAGRPERSAPPNEKDRVFHGLIEALMNRTIVSHVFQERSGGRSFGQGHPNVGGQALDPAGTLNGHFFDDLEFQTAQL